MASLLACMDSGAAEGEGGCDGGGGAKGGERSVWSADVVVVLARFGVEGMSFYTTVAGVDPGHKELAFYQKTLERDAERMPALFEEARRRGVQVQEVSYRGFV